MAERESNEVHICSCETSRLSENSKPADGTPKNLAELEILYSDLIRKLQSEIGEFSDIGVCVSCKKAGRKMQRLELISKAYNERGQLKYLQVNFDGALKDYSSSLDFMLNPVALYNRATIYYRLCMNLFLYSLKWVGCAEVKWVTRESPKAFLSWFAILIFVTIGRNE